MLSIKEVDDSVDRFDRGSPFGAIDVLDQGCKACAGVHETTLCDFHRSLFVIVIRNLVIMVAWIDVCLRIYKTLVCPSLEISRSKLALVDREV